MYQIPKHVEPPSSKGALHKGFKDLMKKPEEPEGINPFFQDAPSFPLRMQSNPKRMAIWFKWLINEIRAGMTKQSASENKGIAKFILEMAMEDPETREQIGYCYKLVVTPESGYFKAVLIPHRELVDELGDAAKPIELAFDFANLYLMGFLYRNIWYLYKDARLSGLNITPENNHFIVIMDFDGGYFGCCHTRIKIGFQGICWTYDTLLNAVQRSQFEVRCALYRIIVSICEPERFPDWMARMLRIYMKKLLVTVDNPEDEPDTKYSWYFNQWGNISGGINDTKHPSGSSGTIDGGKQQLSRSSVAIDGRKKQLSRSSVAIDGRKKQLSESSGPPAGTGGETLETSLRTLSVVLGTAKGSKNNN